MLPTDAAVCPEGDVLDAVVTAPEMLDAPDALVCHAEVTAVSVVYGGEDGTRKADETMETHRVVFSESGSEVSDPASNGNGNNHGSSNSNHAAGKGRFTVRCPLDWFVCAMIVLVVLVVALVGYGFGSGLFLPHHNQRAEPAPPVGSSPDALSPGSSSDPALVDRQDYKDSLLELLGLPSILDRSSPQGRAVEWLAFVDEPLLWEEEDSSAALATAERLVQRYALAVWYFDQGGPQVWRKVNRDPSAGWIEHGAGVHECEWQGVDCDSHTLVGLRLSSVLGLLMTGETLSTELGLLTGLRRIDFANQRLRGRIPDEWAALTNLTRVILSQNQLQTTIPEWIGDWSNLEHLALDRNLMQGTLPASLGTLSKLTHLELQTNLMLEGNFDEVLFSGEDHSPENTLEFLDLSNTDLEGELPPTTLPQLSSLRLINTLGLGGTIPTQIGSWSSLKVLSIEGTSNLQGSIPTELGLLEDLHILEIKDSPEMSGELPSELGNLDRLEIIDFRYTGQTGSLPSEWSNLANLKFILLMENHRLDGTVPPAYANLTNLKALDVRRTGVTEISEEICGIEGLLEVLADCDFDCVCCVCWGTTGGNPND